MKKGIGWFSGGVTSAVAIKLALDAGFDVQIFYFETGAHHPDHKRFIKDCENLYERKITIVRNKKEIDLWNVLRKGYINSPSGAYCTKLLKKDMRILLEKVIEYDFQIFGFEYDLKQINRAIRFQQQYPEAKAVFPLIEIQYNKQQSMKFLTSKGIELPAMYKLGYSNSNCIGCVKGGMGYWNKIRIDFPEIFYRMAKIEREVNATCLRDGKRKLFLDQLEPDRGRHEDISLPECGVTCPTELDGLKEIHDTDFITNRLFVNKSDILKTESKNIFGEFK